MTESGWASGLWETWPGAADTLQISTWRQVHPHWNLQEVETIVLCELSLEPGEGSWPSLWNKGRTETIWAKPKLESYTLTPSSFINQFDIIPSLWWHRRSVMWKTCCLWAILCVTTIIYIYGVDYGNLHMLSVFVSNDIEFNLLQILI